MIEGDIMRKCLIAVSRAGSRMFRNNTALAWVGKVQKITRVQRVAVGPGDVVIRAARPLHAGLVVGGSDLIGITPVLIGAEHVGKTIGVFSAVEVKSEDGTTTTEQENFLTQIKDLGGLAGIARCPEDAVSILSGLTKADAGARTGGKH